MKIGFACKYVHDMELKKKDLEAILIKYNTRTTTHTWLKKQSAKVAENRLIEIIDHNLNSLERTIDYVGGLDPTLKMYRISSDICPLYSHSEWKSFWQSKEIQQKLEVGFSKLGEKIRHHQIRVSFHPGQYTILASDKPDVVERSIEEFEYHVDMARWMGYGKAFQDGCKINIHVGGRGGPSKLIENLGRLSNEGRNLITIENDEFTYGLDEILCLKDRLALVLDIHHHWIKTGEYIDSNDDRVKMVIDSWRGVRPTLHYSLSREDVLPEHSKEKRPDLKSLLEAGLSKNDLRAHSDFYWNEECNRWAFTFLDNFDIMCESKMKNLASKKLFEDFKSSLKERLKITSL